MPLSLNQWNQLVPVANRSQGSVLTTGNQKVQNNVTGGTIRMDVPMTGVSFPFNNPAAVVQLDLFASWDGGVTYQQVYSQGANGSSTGVWGKNNAFPTWGLDVPVDMQGNRADHFRAEFTVVGGGPISFGLSLHVS